MSQLPNPRIVEVTSATDPKEAALSLSVHEGGTGPAVVLCHGFPELAWSWRHQYQPLIDAGFRVIIPNQRGYDGSTSPEGIEAYDLEHLTGDLVGLLDALDIEQAIFVGHDWGGFVAWAMPILHPTRTLGVIGVNTPYSARSALPPTQILGMMAGEDKGSIYILWFQEPGVAESVLDANPSLVFEKLMRRARSPAEMMAAMANTQADMNPFRRLETLPATGDELLDAAELETYVQAFTRSGFRGGVSWYRNFDRNWEKHPEIGVQKIEHPALMITAEWDLVLSPAMAADMPSRCDDLETVMIPECGHWTQQEKPEELNRLMIDWLKRRFG